MSDSVQYLLNALRAELKQQQLWSAAAPDIAALQSTLPFCCDTLSLQQWLQFVFLPRMQALLDAKQALPAKAGILPIAEQAFQAEGRRLAPLLSIIARLDVTLSGAQ